MMRAYLIFKYSIFGFLYLTFFGLSTIGCGGSPNGTNTAGPGPHEVFMQNTAFVPATRTIPVNTEVTWTNKDGYNHTATSGVPGSPSGLFDSGIMGQNATYTFTFATAGTYLYFCTIHGAMMTGTIVITP